MRWPLITFFQCTDRPLSTQCLPPEDFGIYLALLAWFDSYHPSQKFFRHSHLDWVNAEYMSRCMGKPAICIGESKDADQLRSNCEADQRLCFRYRESAISLLLKSEISSF